MKKVISLLLILVLSFSFCVSFANEEISVEIDGKKQQYDVMPVIINGRTMVPMRGIFEALGAEVFWDETNKSVAATKDDVSVLLTIDSTNAKLNRNDVVLDAAPVIINSRTLVPVRFISEALGNEVNWIAETRTVVINTKPSVSDADKLYEELNLTNIILDEKEYFSNGRFNYDQYGTAEHITSGIDGYNNVLRVSTTEVPPKPANFIYKYRKTVEGIKEGDSLLMVLTFRTVSSDSPDGLGKIQVQLEEPVNFQKAIFEEFTAGKEWTTYYMPVENAVGHTGTGIRFGFNKQVVEIAQFKYINCGSITVDKLPNTKAGGIVSTSTPSGNNGNNSNDGNVAAVAPEGVDLEAQKLYKELNLTNIILDEKEYFSNGRFNNGQYGTWEYVTGGIDGYTDVLRVSTTEVPAKASNFIYKYTKTVEGIKEGDSLLMVLTFRTLSTDSPDGLGKIQVQLEEPVNFQKAIFEEFTAGKEWTTYYMPVENAFGYNGTGIRFGFNKQVVEIAEFKYINCGSLTIDKLPNNTFTLVLPSQTVEFEQGKDNMDIFICLGQSNMQGAGTIAPEDIYDFKSSYILNKESKWEELGYESTMGKNVLGFNRYSSIMPSKDGSKLGPLDYMAREIENKVTDRKIGYVVNARGGISIKTYLPGSEEGYYESTLERCKEAQKYGTIKGIIWHQGESDASKDEYIGWLTTMVEAFKKDLGLKELPIIAGELLNNFPERIKFNENLKANEDALNLKVVSSEGLTDRGDTAHFSDDSYREFGKRYAAAVLEKIYNTK